MFSEFVKKKVAQKRKKEKETKRKKEKL